MSFHAALLGKTEKIIQRPFQDATKMHPNAHIIVKASIKTCCQLVLRGPHLKLNSPVADTYEDHQE